MRARVLILSAASASAVAWAVPALAQTTDQTPPPPRIQTAPIQPATGGARVGDVVVTGTRESLRSARELKRDADEVIDVIVAEDIGKLPDTNASESLARVTGVHVERGGGEASRVLVRGLPDVSTTYNGRDIFTAEGRGVALQDFPAAAVASLEVFKSSSAWRLESGIAGLINVRSRRPFDFEGLEIAGSVRGTYATQSGAYDPNGDLLISNRWTTGIGEIGVLANVSYTQLRYLDSVRWNAGVIGEVTTQSPDPALAGARFPDAVGVYYGSGDRTRPSANIALQWRPDDRWEFYLDGLYQTYRGEVSDRQFVVPLYAADTTFSNVVLRPGSNEILSLTRTTGLRPEMYQTAALGETETWQVAVGGVYSSGPVEWSFDIARTDSTFTNSIHNIDAAFASSPVVDISYDVDREDGGTEFSFRDFDASDPSNYIYRGLFDRRFQGVGDDVQVRTDLKYQTASALFPEVRFGLRYVERNAGYRNGERYLNQEALRLPLASLPVELTMAPAGFRGSDVHPFRTWVTPTYQSIRDNIEALRVIAGFAPGDPPVIPEQTFAATETAWTGYGQAAFAFTFGVPIRGDLGLRIVSTEVSVDGTTRATADGVETFTPVLETSRYTDLLPSLNLRAALRENVQLRLAANQTRTRPGFGQLNPGLFVSPNPDSSGLRGASGGNIDLTPIQSTNYDAVLEYYFGEDGSATIGVFRREIDGFIVNQTEDVVDPVYGALRITRPQNLDAAVLQGVEAAFTTFFDYEGVPGWARHFGVQVNGTVIDGDLPFISRYAYNLVAMYENGPVSARLAYNVRTKFDTGTVGEFVDDVARLDFSASYTPIENVTLAFDVSNILGEPFRNFFDYGEGVYPRDVRREETLYGLAVRWRY